MPKKLEQLQIAKAVVEVKVEKGEEIPIVFGSGYKRIYLGLGPNQIALIQKIMIQPLKLYEDSEQGTIQPGLYDEMFALFRRTEGIVRRVDDPVYAGAFDIDDLCADEDIVYVGRQRTMRSTSFIARHESDFPFDSQLTLIRDPQLVYGVWAWPYSGTTIPYSEHSAMISLYYKTVIVSPDLMTKLLVKDHS